MWQEILAIDSRVNDRRMMEAKDLRPLYIKRRMQLLQAQGQPTSHRKLVNPECDPDQCDQYVMRNKKYISLRVKLLKKQFGLPSDLTSLRLVKVCFLCQSAIFTKNLVMFQELDVIAQSQ